MEENPKTPETPTYLGQVFSDKLTLIPLLFAVALIGLGIYSAFNPTEPGDISGPLGMGNGPLLYWSGAGILGVAFLVPLFSKELRRKRGL